MFRILVASTILILASAITWADDGETIKVKAGGEEPTAGYLSSSIGAFTLDGKKGHASFRWNHGLDVDWHDLALTFVGSTTDDDEHAYWIYEAQIVHGDHEDKVQLLFAQMPHGEGEGYRIFVSHGDDIHELHLLALDAVRLPYHK